MYNGYMAAVATPFKDGKLDIKSFEKYISCIVVSGISGIVVCGSTGEALSLSMREKIELVKIASQANNKKIKIIAGVIDAATDNCIELIKKTEDYVNGFLCICPFYVKPSQSQIYNHFLALSKSTSKDIILYNNPSRVGASINFEIFKKLSALENIVAIKECSEDLSRFALWRSRIKGNFDFLTGNDDSACAALAMGAKGVISVSANIAPDLCSRMYNHFRQKDMDRFSELRDIIAPLHQLMFAEPSPAPVKYALHKLGLMSEELRPPLTAISVDLKEKIDDFMIKTGLI